MACFRPVTLLKSNLLPTWHSSRKFASGGPITLESLCCIDPEFEKQRKKFKRISLMGLPIVFLTTFVLFTNDREEEKAYHRPDPYIPYSYLVIRNKPFPWKSDKTLFHNPHKNRLSTGWDDEED